MIRCLVVDDEPLARRHLIQLLSAHDDVQVCAQAAHGAEAIERVIDERPDVVFADVEMPGLNGFDLVTQMERSPLVVFVTAYDEHAVQAFEVNAVDYLLKPIHAERVARTIERLRGRLAGPPLDHAPALARVRALLRTGPPAKLVAHRGRRVVLLAPREVLCAAVADRLVFLHTDTDRFVVNRTIGDLETLLSGARFVRISRSALVNIDHARTLFPSSSGTWRITLANGLELAVSRERARELRSRVR
jgi:two-component system LytT family response regulator